MLDRAELVQAAFCTLGRIQDSNKSQMDSEIILDALTDIAKRAFEQAAWPGVSNDMHMRPARALGDPPMLLPDVLAALDCVDIVAEQDDRVPDELIRLLKPAAFARGADFVEANVRERVLVESLGGRVVICGGPKTHSTERIVRGAEHPSFGSG